MCVTLRELTPFGRLADGSRAVAPCFQTKGRGRALAAALFTELHRAAPEFRPACNCCSTNIRNARERAPAPALVTRLRWSVPPHEVLVTTPTFDSSGSEPPTEAQPTEVLSSPAPPAPPAPAPAPIDAAQMVAAEPAVAAVASPGQADLVIELDHVGKQFGDVVAVQDISLHVARGSVLGVIGPSGAGKTTTIRMISGGIS